MRHYLVKIAQYGLILGFSLSVSAPHAAAQGMFGSIELRAPLSNALPQWHSVIRKMQAQAPVFEACLMDAARCPLSSLRNWRNMMHGMAGRRSMADIRYINAYINQWPYITDYQLWGVEDYWASPMEFLPKSGDCEDYAILKMLTFERLGIGTDRRIVVVRDTIRGNDHAVMSMKVNGQTLILDSLFSTPLADSQVLQYRPYYSVNHTQRWVHVTPRRR